MMRTRSIQYRVLVWVALLISIILLLQMGGNLTKVESIPVDDFVRHWAAGRIFFKAGDPYSAAQIQVWQDVATGPELSSPVITPNYVAPWTMPLLAIFGLLDYPASRLAWLIFNISIVLLSAELLWKLYDGPARRKWVIWLVCFSFGPTISVLGKGQTSCLILLGAAGFLFFMEKRENYYIAGIFAALITVKPQVFYLFWIILLLWAIQNRNYFTILGALGTIVLLSAITLFFDKNIFIDYLNAVRYNPPSMFATPTIGGYVRYFFTGPEMFWPQFIPLPIGIAVSIYYFYKHQHSWNWRSDLPVIFFVSILTSSYCWTYDQVILLVPVAQIWSSILTLVEKAKIRLVAVTYLLPSIVDMILHRFLDDFWFIWFAPAILLWYYIVNKNRRVAHEA